MSHRDFVHKRAPHQAIAARFIPTYSYPGQTSDSSAPTAPTSTPAKTTDSINPFTPPAATPQTSTASTTSSTTSTTPTSTSTTSTSSSSSSSSSSSARSTPLPPVPVTTTPINTKVVPGTPTFSPTTTSTPTATSTPSSSSGPSTAAIVGGVAGALVGIAILGFIIMWCMRRQRNRDDDDDFDPSVFKRQSAILVDDPLEPQQTYHPRPPTMLERHNASPALAAQAGYGGQNFYGNYGGYNQQPSYASPEMNSYAGSPPPHPYGTAAAMGYAYNAPPQGLARPPSDPAYLARQPSPAAGYGMLSPPSDAHYVDLNRTSVTPFQASQYADISNRLGTPDPNAHAVQPKEPATLLEERLPSPFDNPAEVFPSPPTATAPVNQSATLAVQPRQNATEHAQRPSSAYTIYEEGDAYDGI